MRHLKGMIEAVDGNIVTGWVAAHDADLRGVALLAFLDDECIGSGHVESFRQDLADAGLGNGFAGFRIATSPLFAEDRPRVMVKFEGGDFWLLQPGSKLAAPCVKAREEQPAHLHPLGQQWMMTRGWLQQADYDFLKFFERLGVYERLLQLCDSEGEGQRQLELSSAARNAFEMLALRDVKVEERQVKTVEELQKLLTAHAEQPSQVPCLALWSADRRRISFREGSHTGDVAAKVMSPLVEYTLGSDRLVLVSTKLVVEAKWQRTGHTLVYSGVMAE